MKKLKLSILITSICLVLVATIIVIFLLINSRKKDDENTFEYSYGVFLGINNDEIFKLKKYRTVVIEGEEFDKTHISTLKSEGHEVFAYINIGALEEYRSYFSQFEHLALGDYENWEDEKWINVANKDWQDFIFNELSKSFFEKGFDGFFVDNCDVYYNYETDEIYNGVVAILKNLMSYNKKVIINSGDMVVKRYVNENANISDIMTGVNQESVFSSIVDYKNDVFKSASEEDTEYYLEYLSLVEKHKGDIYILEYTKNAKLIKKIKKHCSDKSWNYYISKTVGLT